MVKIVVLAQHSLPIEAHFVRHLNSMYHTLIHLSTRHKNSVICSYTEILN
jgi:hypothetical protein